MTETSTCMGCFVRDPDLWMGAEIRAVNPSFPVVSQGLTIQEKECLEHLALSWNLFNTLEDKHPSDNHEFLTAIHDCQKIIALRVARRIDKDVWTQGN